MLNHYYGVQQMLNLYAGLVPPTTPLISPSLDPPQAETTSLSVKIGNAIPMSFAAQCNIFRGSWTPMVV